jgi:hypothetical protein
MMSTTKAEMKAIKDRIRVTKIVCTRSVKGKGGDSFVGFSAEFDSVQDDGSLGLENTLDEPTQSGVSLKEAKVAALVLGLNVDIAAYDKAVAGSVCTVYEAQTAKNATKTNYGRLMRALLGDEAPGSEE